MAKKKSRKKKTNIKKSHKGTYLGITLVVLVALIVAIALMRYDAEDKGSGNNPQTTSGENAAVVNGVPILMSTLEERYEELPAVLKQTTTRADVLNQMVEEELVNQQAESYGITVDDEEVIANLNQMLVQNRLTLEQFEQSLQEQGVKFDEFVEIYRQRLLVSKLFNATILSNVDVSVEEARQYYEDNEESFQQEEQVEARHILVNDSETADEILEMIEQGEEFGALAMEYSEGPSSVDGGYLGYFGKGTMVAEFEQAAFDLAVGEVSEPVKTDFGWHIIKVTDKKEAGLADFEEVKDQIIENLEFTRARDTFILYMEGLKQGQGVKILYEGGAEMTGQTPMPQNPVTGESTDEPEPTVTEPMDEPSAQNEPSMTEEQESEQAMPEQSDEEGLAACLKSKGVKLYGAYWNKDTQDQLQMFGDDQDNLDYVECGIQGDYAAQTQECDDEGILGYPTWKFADGRMEAGKLTEEQLMQMSGC